jgi:hypothetical protein
LPDLRNHDVPVVLALKRFDYEIGAEVARGAVEESTVSILSPEIDAGIQFARLTSLKSGMLAGAARGADVSRFLSAANSAGRKAEYLSVVADGDRRAVHFLVRPT